MKQPSRTFFSSTVGKVALATSVMLAFGGFVLANTGGSEDPLISLSYLQQTILPQLTVEGQSYGDSASGEMVERMDEAIASLREELSGDTGTVNHFQLVSLSQGQSVALDVGAQVVLRIGSCQVEADSSPALVNLTQGGSLDSGGSLTENHLYLSTIAGRKLIALGGSVKVMISGGYTILN